MRNKIFKLVVPIGVLGICFLALELILSIWFGSNEEFYIWNPGLEFEYSLDNKYLEDISQNANLKYNSIGARSEEVYAGSHRKIIAFGGSTTECLALDQPNTWTYQLEDLLTTKEKKYWIANFGKSGDDTNHHILQTKAMLKNSVVSESDTFMYLIGYNDALKSVQYPNRYLNTSDLELKIKSFMVVPDSELPFHRKLAIFKFLKYMNFKIRLNRFDKEDLNESYGALKTMRKQVELVDKLPDLTEAIAHYSSNIQTIIDLNIKHGKKSIFVTQPVIWKETLTAKEKEKVVVYFDNRPNLSINALKNLMDQFNATLINVCEKNQVKYIDLASQSQPNWFYDDCHFNITGAQAVARYLSTEID